MVTAAVAAAFVVAAVAVALVVVVEMKILLLVDARCLSQASYLFNPFV